MFVSSPLSAYSCSTRGKKPVVSLQNAALLMVGSALFVCGGCSEDILAQPENRQPLMSQERILTFAEQRAEAMGQMGQRILGILDSVQDEDSAQQALEELKKLESDIKYAERQSKDKFGVEMTEEEYQEWRKKLEAIELDAMGDPKEFSRELGAVQDSIYSNRSISANNRNKLEHLIRGVYLLREYGRINSPRLPAPEELVTVIVENNPGAGVLGDYLGEKTKVSGRSTKYKDGVLRMKFHPYEDLQSFVDSIDVGRVVRVNVKTRSILMELSQEDVASLQQYAQDQGRDVRRGVRNER